MSQHSAHKVEIHRESAEKLVYVLLTEYLKELEWARDFCEETDSTTLMHDQDPKKELKELKKDIRAIRRVRSYYV